jgi:hypothetical protein
MRSIFGFLVSGHTGATAAGVSFVPILHPFYFVFILGDGPPVRNPAIRVWKPMTAGAARRNAKMTMRLAYPVLFVNHTYQYKYTVHTNCPSTLFQGITT